MVLERKEALTTLHPWAWWCWAIGIGLAVSATTNPLLLALLATAVVVVVMLRRGSAPWARSVKAYLLLALFVIGMRVFFQVVMGANAGETVLFALPEVPLPDWAAGIRLGGAVTAEGLAATLYDAFRLAVMLLCLGAANALANPRQALRSVPAALYEASVAVVIALSVAPQLIESVQRVRKARRLRGDSTTGLKTFGTIALPVLADAIDRSLSLAAGMEARGFARTKGLPVAGTLPVMLVSSMTAVMGVFLLLSTSWWEVAAVLVVLGGLGTALGLRRAGARLRVTRYLPHPWGARETVVAASGVVAAAFTMALGWTDVAGLTPGWAALLAPGALAPSTYPLVWPELTVPMLLIVALVVVPLAATRARTRPDETAATPTAARLRGLRPRPSEHTRLVHS